eukprot:6209405-Pleurochrysis_carterae.AAC.4
MSVCLSVWGSANAEIVVNRKTLMIHLTYALCHSPCDVDDWLNAIVKIICTAGRSAIPPAKIKL